MLYLHYLEDPLVHAFSSPPPPLKRKDVRKKKEEKKGIKILLVISIYDISY